MELKPATTSSWIPGVLPAEISPGGAAPRAVLLFGPDQGGVMEFTRLLARSEQNCDTVPAQDLDLSEAIAALTSGSLFGGTTSLRIDGAGDRELKAIQVLLETEFAEGARLFVAGGDLKAGSKLRKLFQSRKDCVSAPLYMMKDREIVRAAQGFFKSQGLGIEADAGALLGQRLSGDRATTARACEVVALHAAGRGASRVSVADLKSVLDTVDEEGLSAPLDRALLGDVVGASLGITRRLDEGESFVALLRIFAGRAFRFRELLATGKRPADAVASAKPPVFWTDKDMFVRILSDLTLDKLDKILGLIDRTEIRIIEDGVPEAAAMPALMFEIARHKTWKD